MRLVIDGTIYNVGMLSCKRSWESQTLYDVTTLDGVRHRQLWGSYPVYTLTLGNVDAAAYDRLVEQLVTATAPCTVELPSGQTGFSAFTATFSRQTFCGKGFPHPKPPRWSRIIGGWTAAFRYSPTIRRTRPGGCGGRGFRAVPVR